jgi:hypothetical protein
MTASHALSQLSYDPEMSIKSAKVEIENFRCLQSAKRKVIAIVKGKSSYQGFLPIINNLFSFENGLAFFEEGGNSFCFILS